MLCSDKIITSRLFFHLKMSFLYIIKFQHTIIPVTANFETVGLISSIPENSSIRAFDINKLIMKSMPYIISCLYMLPCDLKDHALFKEKLMIKPSVMAMELDHTYHNSRMLNNA